MYDSTKPYNKRIQEMISMTWNQYVRNGITLIEKLPGNIIDHTDGIGTKGFYHWQEKTFSNAVIDALAMNINDLAMLGARPFKLQNHIFLPNDENVLEVMQHLVIECQKRNIAITGGETSIHDNMEGMDISITMSGLVDEIRPKMYEMGDILVGIPSSGLHSNGFTRIRKLFPRISRLEFTIPTRIYNLDNLVFSACNHITGGAYTKLRSGLGNYLDAKLDFNNYRWQIFKEIYEKGFSSEEMYKTFNCGYGMILGIRKNNLDYTLEQTKGDVVGEITPGTGEIFIKSAFDRSLVSL